MLFETNNSKRNPERKRLTDDAIRQEKYVQEQIPHARKWLEEHLFDAIAKATMKGEHELYLSYSIGGNMPPIESVAIAIEETDGLRIKKIWCQESADPNSESSRYRIAAHWSYYVVWD